MITMTNNGDKFRRSKMQELAQVMFYLREQAGHTVRAVADFAGASPKDVNRWEAGEDVPDNQRWSRMCQMNRQLQRYRSLWTEARAERDAAKAAPLTTKLADKLASIKLEPVTTPAAVEALPPVVQAKVSPDFGKGVPSDYERPTLAELTDERKETKDVVMAAMATPAVAPAAAPERKAPPGFDVRQLPEGWRNADRVKEREDFARQMFRDNPETTPADVRAAQQSKFGVATDRGRMVALRTEEMTKLQKAAKKAAKAVAKEPTPAKAPTVQDSIAAATELLLESIPNLASFTVTVSPEGQATVAYTTREVKVVETSGTITVGVRK